MTPNRTPDQQALDLLTVQTWTTIALNAIEKAETDEEEQQLTQQLMPVYDQLEESNIKLIALAERWCTDAEYIAMGDQVLSTAALCVLAVQGDIAARRGIEAILVDEVVRTDVIECLRALRQDTPTAVDEVAHVMLPLTTAMNLLALHSEPTMKLLQDVTAAGQ